MKRDIVQFVELRKYGSSSTSMSKLAEDTLEEFPRQFLSYFEMWGITPMESEVSGTPVVVNSPSVRQERSSSSGENRPSFPSSSGFLSSSSSSLSSQSSFPPATPILSPQVVKPIRIDYGQPSSKIFFSFFWLWTV